jgi:Cof subfamily protein (haloacid dehalogenase superfamily)
MSNIRLLALDLDGTLIDSQGNISEENRRAIIAAEETGVLVTIATGRRFRDARPVAIEVGLNAAVLTHNGALTKNAETLETFESELILTETSIEIISLGKAYGGDALVSVDPHGKGTLIYETLHGDNIPLRRYVEWARILHGDDAENAVLQVDDLEGAAIDNEVIHISFSGTCRSMKLLASELEKGLGNSVNLLATIYPHLDFTLLDILPPGSSKAAGLEKLAGRHGFTRDQVMSVGDNFNDLEMLEYAGTAVVMGNADESLRLREEFYTTLTNDESGVAAAIKTHILGVENV